MWSTYLSETWARVPFYPCRAHLMRCFVGVWCVRGRGEPRQRAHSHRAGTRGAAAEPRLALYPAFLSRSMCPSCAKGLLFSIPCALTDRCAAYGLLHTAPGRHLRSQDPTPAPDRGFK